MKESLKDYQYKPLTFLWRSYKPYWVWLLFTVLSYQIYKILGFYIGYPLKLLIDRLPSYSSWTDGIYVIGLLVGILLIGDIALRITRFFAIALEKRIRLSVSQRLIEYTLNHSVEYFAKRMSGSVVNRNISVVSSMTGITENIFVYGLLPGITGIIVSLAIFSSLNSTLVWIFIIWLTPFALTVHWLNKPLGKVAEELAQKQSSYVGMLSDTIANQSTVRLFNGAETEFSRLKPSFFEATEAWVKEIKTWEYSQFTKSTLILFLYIAIYIALIILYINRQITLGDIAFSVGIIVTAAESIRNGAMSIDQYYGSKGTLKDNLEDLLEPHDIIDIPQSEDLKVTKGELEIKDITFNYPNKRPIFKNFNLLILPKQKVGIIGKSGAGKSSLISILLRLYPFQKGKIFIDGQDISMMSQKSLRQNITYVPQDPYLFHRTVKENILYGSENASYNDVVKAAKLAQAHEFISKLPNGYDSVVGERGILLSGGQRQRIAIARAFIKNAPILIMDEATSALDSESEAAIQKALQNLVQDKTVIVVAHRLSTLMIMDRIAVLEDGKISEDGAHSELLKNNGTYSDLWNRQTGNFIEE